MPLFTEAKSTLAFALNRVVVHTERHQSLDADGQLFRQLHHLLRRRHQIQVPTLPNTFFPGANPTTF
jgi:hypothetical protein